MEEFQNTEKWKDCGTYYLSLADQRSEDWHKSRKVWYEKIGDDLKKRYRLTASNFGAAIGKSKYPGSEPLDIALSITDLKPKIFTDKAKFVMQHGVVTEEPARNWYMKEYNVEVKEVGLAIPKWDFRIGGSVDGDILNSDGIIEIKCPLTMYRPLQIHTDKIKRGWIPPNFYHDHISESHYAQMQGCMKITNKKWCDYIVYVTTDKTVYVERVKFDEKYWNEILYPGINEFFEKVLNPLVN